MKLPRFVRLLPLVVLAIAALLVLNGTGLLHDGIALAETAAGALTDAPEPSNRDFAEPDQQIASAAEADIMTSLSRRRAELDARQAQVKLQADILAAAEKRVDAKIAQLQALQDKMAGLIQQHDEQQQAQIAALTKTYIGMGKKAGPIFAGLPDDVAVPVAQAMKPADLALIMSGMPADAAQKLTVKLASRLTLPQTADAPAPAPAAAAAPATPDPSKKQP
jgi:flagellar motility protein MotE (MotC chaperone)